jgi:phosphohistidine phosphatase
MKKLILLRHAKSDWSGWGRSLDFVSDIERPLSRRGIKACAKISKLFMTMQVSVDLVEYSSARRALDTFNLIRNAVLFSAHKENPELYTFSSKKLMQTIAKTSKEINGLLLVGHNPAIEEIVDDLALKAHNLKDLKLLREKYPTGAIAFMELNILCWSDVAENCGRLTKFVRPIDL